MQLTYYSHITSVIVHLILCTFSASHWSCYIPGCKGYGNLSNSLENYHHNIKDCPYEINSWKIGISRLGGKPNVITTSKLARYY